MFALIRSIRQRDPAQPTFMEVILSYPGFHILLFHRVAHFIWYKLKWRALARFISHLGRFFTGIEIHPGAKIGKLLFIDHGMGTVIGETSILGDNITIYHGVTLGGRGIIGETGKRHPTIGNNVIIGAGAQIIGNINISDNAKIAANALITSYIHEGADTIGIHSVNYSYEI